MSEPSRILIYGLLDPLHEELFYIGQTRKRREFRLLEHIECAVQGRPAPVHQFIRRLMDEGRIPSIFVLERVGATSAADAIERGWIAYYASPKNFQCPHIVQPQTRKSHPVQISSVSLTNVRDNPAQAEGPQ